MVKFKALSCAALSFVLLAGAQAHAETDQVNALPTLLANSEIDSRSPLSVYQQEIRAGVAGVLSQVDLYQSGVVPFQSFRLFINRGFNWQTDADDFSTTVSTGAGGTISVDLAGAGLLFNAGDYFMLGIQGLGPDTTPAGLMFGSDYSAGRLYLNAGVMSGTTADMAFTTYMVPVPVPEPSSTYLYLVGLAALMLVKRAWFGGQSRRWRAGADFNQ